MTQVSFKRRKVLCIRFSYTDYGDFQWGYAMIVYTEGPSKFLYYNTRKANIFDMYKAIAPWIELMTRIDNMHNSIIARHRIGKCVIDTAINIDKTYWCN